ncbi:MAG: sulfate ABC transporter ATP-binding protein [Candidatus Omnitrophica bacterium]|nr:sulfate ABC transporter ATP-binding protein [Candidatus Omnitrophota bacterium]
MSIKVDKVTKTFGQFKALDEVSLDINTGELIALLGPSGSGKTTLLRIIAGLETAEAGEILFHGEDTKETKVKDRNVGFVFQHYALFRHMTVFENIAFGLRVKPKHLRPTDAQIKERVHELLRLVQLDWVANRYPAQLSGGQRQRIALARALAIEPRVLLLDEPFGSLDAQVRKELRQWLRRFHDDLHITTLFVTHDQEEALEVADKIVVMNKGKIEQVGSPQDVYHNPASVFVLNFLGNVNIFHARIEEEQGAAGKPRRMYVRPHQLTVSRFSLSADSVKAAITFINPAGSMVKIDAKSRQGEIFQVEVSQEEHAQLKLAKNDEVFLTPKKITYCEYDI